MESLPLLVSQESKQSVVSAMADELGLSDSDKDLALALFHQGLPPLSHPHWLPYLFGVSSKLIGAMGSQSDHYYRRFTLRKRSGGVRKIVTPRRFLKTVQRWILHRILNHVEIDDAAYGFVPGHNIFDNAEPHLSGRNVMVVDIENFFPSVNEKQILRVFSRHFPFPKAVASQLTALCTLDGALPQGAPTSPTLANIVFAPTDSRLRMVAARWEVHYTRYADDLAFSGSRRFTKDDIATVEGFLNEAGFSSNRQKARRVGPGQRQIVAGLVVNEKGQPPRETRRRWRAMFHRASKHPKEFMDRVDELDGICSFINQYDPATATSYRTVVEQVRQTQT